MKVVLIGTGNVATHLGPAIQESGHSIIQVYSRRIENAERLADEVKATAIDQLDQMDQNADLYLLMVTDDAISEVAASMPKVNGTVAHTAGSVGMKVLNTVSEHYGVLWTPQTFSKDRKPDLTSAPFCIEGSADRSKETLFQLASGISNDVRELDDEQRKVAHLAAVIGSNFSNHMYTMAAKLLEKHKMDLSLLGPLLTETLNKALDIGPELGQTGPARRGDQHVIKEQLEALSNEPELKRLYEELSSAITKYYGG